MVSHGFYIQQNWLLNHTHSEECSPELFLGEQLESESQTLNCSESSAQRLAVSHSITFGSKMNEHQEEEVLGSTGVCSANLGRGYSTLKWGAYAPKQFQIHSWQY
jgi:hypothetical protein